MAPFSSKLPPGVRRVFRFPWNRRRVERDLDEEMRVHLAMRIDELRALGLSQSEAGAEAARRFGDEDEFRHYTARRAARLARRHRVAGWLAEWTQDLRFAGRQFARTPAFTGIVLLTLALGIGATTAIVSVVHRVLISPLPYPNGSRIVKLMGVEDARGLQPVADSVLLGRWKASGRAATMIAAAEATSFLANPDETIDMTPVAFVTTNFLDLLGVRPALGRGFVAVDARPTAPPVVMISMAMWKRNHGGNPDVIGKAIRLEGTWRTIVGVMPGGVTIPMSPDLEPAIWTPVSSAGESFALLRPGTSASDAERELQGLASTLPDSVARRRPIRVMRAQDFLDPREVRSIQVLLATVGTLLLVACANVANLLLARASTRRRELAVRISLGAGRWRIARQILTESLALALGGAALGVGVSWVALEVILSLRPPPLAHLADVGIEPAILLWSLGIAIATGLVFGSIPALYAGSRQAGDVLRSDTRSATTGTAARRTRSALIVLEVASSLTLLIGAGLLARSFLALKHLRLGFEPRGLVYVNFGTFPDRGEVVREAVMDRLRRVPGVTDVVVGPMPGTGFVVGRGLESETGGRIASMGTDLVGMDYLRVARLHLLEGRLPDWSVASTAWRARRGLFGYSAEVVVSRELARRLSPSGGAIGSRVRPASLYPRSVVAVEPWSTVVGVVDDVRMPGLRGDRRALQLYSLMHPSFADVPLLVRVTGSGDEALPAIERVLQADRRIVVRPLVSGETYLRDSLAPTRFAMVLLTAFAILALVVAAVGLYGVVAFSVAQRTREIGVRMALGAGQSAVTGLVAREALRLALIGSVVGVAIAVATSRVLASMLYQVSPADPVTFLVVGFGVIAVAWTASYLPARRAARIQPTEALRAD
jgi:predicted permease